MVLDETYYSETPIRVTVVEPEPVDRDVEGGQANDESDDGDAASDRATQVPTFRIEEGATTPTTGNTDKVVDPDNAAPGGKALSQVLSDQLAMQRRDVLGAALIASPGLALDYMLFAMVDGRRASSNDGTTIRADRPQDPILSNNMPASRARDHLTEVHDGLDASWMESSNQVLRFEAFRALGDEVKSAWLAYIVATSLEAKIAYGSNRQNPLHGRLANILDIDVASWWRPTSENFFDRVSKGSLISLLHEVGGPALSSRHATEKKPEVSASCQKLFGGDAIVEPEIKEAALKWLPTAMCFTNPVTEAEAAKTDEQQGNLADLIDGDDDQTDPDADDGLTGGDDLATLIGDGPDDGSDQQDGDVGAGQLEHHNDDAVTEEIVAAE
ncbi:MAG: ParB family chromosome partitioning protein [Sphingomonas echinoides]|jgi:ParB family chromosome partitioning protein